MLAILIFAGGADAATVTCDRSTVIQLIGPLVAGDQQKVVACWEALTQPTNEERALLAEMNKKEPGRYTLAERSIIKFVISSQGGLVSEAMKIGRYVRSKKIWVAVQESGECFSSCVYILASGVVKWPVGKVGIHRPYFLAAPDQPYDAALKATLRESKAFFQEMNVPEFLADDMFSIPPDDMKLLGDSLLTRYRLNQNDMAYDEDNTMRNAAIYGLSRQEYMARLKRIEQYMDECLARYRGNASTSEVASCGITAYRKAGLVPKN